MKVKDKIYIDLNTEQVDQRVFEVLTYRNPEYYQKSNMGISVRGIPTQIFTYSWDQETNQLEVMRGEALKIKPYVQVWMPEFYHSDHPIKLQYINNDFELDECQEGAVEAMKQHRQGIVHAVTSAGKSLIICKAIAEMGQRALIVVHRKILMEQLLEDIDKYIRDEKGEKIKVGIIGAGSKTIGDITIGIDKTLSKNIELVRESFGILLLDECHLAPAKTISDLINSINAKSRFGLTGTLKRKDQKEFLIYATFGQVIYKIGKDELLSKGRICSVDVNILESETQFDWDQVVTMLSDQGHKNPTMKARQLQEETIAGNWERKILVLNHVKKLYDSGCKIMIISRYVAPCYELQKELLERFNIESGVITGKDSKEAVESYKQIKYGDSKVVFATMGCVSTGVSVSDLTDAVLISPIYTNELLLHQIRGRLMRTAEGKEKGILHFVFDPYIFQEKKLKEFLRIMKK